MPMLEKIDLSRVSFLFCGPTPLCILSSYPSSFPTMNFHPSNDSSDLAPLAFIMHNNSPIRVMWRRKTREAVLELSDMTHIVKPDTSIIESIAEVVGCKPHEVSLTNLFIYEFPHNGHKATRELRHSIYSCDWSDYGSDKMGFACTVVVRSYLPESYYQGQTS